MSVLVVRYGTCTSKTHVDTAMNRQLYETILEVPRGKLKS